LDSTFVQAHNSKKNPEIQRDVEPTPTLRLGMPVLIKCLKLPQRE